MAKLGKVTPASRLAIARSATMLAVKQGTPRPDISTVEKFKQAMLDAKSVAYSGPGAGSTGAHMAKVVEQLGIAEALKRKTILGPGGPAGLIGNYLVRGEAEIGIQQDSELMAVPGVDIVGPLPGEIGLVTEFVFGVHTGARDCRRGEGAGRIPAIAGGARGDESQRPDAGLEFYFFKSPNAPFLASVFPLHDLALEMILKNLRRAADEAVAERQLASPACPGEFDHLLKIAVDLVDDRLRRALGREEAVPARTRPAC